MVAGIQINSVGIIQLVGYKCYKPSFAFYYHYVHSMIGSIKVHLFYSKSLHNVTISSLCLYFFFYIPLCSLSQKSDCIHGSYFQTTIITVLSSGLINWLDILTSLIVSIKSILFISFQSFNVLMSCWADTQLAAGEGGIGRASPETSRDLSYRLKIKKLMFESLPN